MCCVVLCCFRVSITGFGFRSRDGLRTQGASELSHVQLRGQATRGGGALIPHAHHQFVIRWVELDLFGFTIMPRVICFYMIRGCPLYSHVRCMVGWLSLHTWGLRARGSSVCCVPWRWRLWTGFLLALCSLQLLRLHLTQYVICLKLHCRYTFGYFYDKRMLAIWGLVVFFLRNSFAVSKWHVFMYSFVACTEPRGYHEIDVGHF